MTFWCPVAPVHSNPYIGTKRSSTRNRSAVFWMHHHWYSLLFSEWSVTAQKS